MSKVLSLIAALLALAIASTQVQAPAKQKRHWQNWAFLRRRNSPLFAVVGP